MVEVGLWQSALYLCVCAELLFQGLGSLVVVIGTDGAESEG